MSFAAIQIIRDILEGVSLISYCTESLNNNLNVAFNTLLVTLILDDMSKYI